MTSDEKETIRRALLKRATGYTAHESVEEYGTDKEGNETLLKRKETEKDVPGDVSAAKLLFDLDGERTAYDSYTDEQLKSLCKTMLADLKDLLK